MLKVPRISDTAYLIKQLPTPIVFIDNTFTIVHESNKWMSTFHPENDQCKGQTIFEVFPDLSPKYKLVLQQCFKGNPQPMGIHKAKDAKNNECWFEWTNTPWYDLHENIIGAIIQLNDVTDSVQKELEIKKKEELLKQQSEITKLGIWEFNLINNELTWCSTTKTIHEVPPDYIPNVENAIHFYKEGNNRNAISMALLEAKDTGKPWNLKLQIITAKGKEKWIMAAGKPIYDEDKLVGLFGTCQDINEQVEADIKTLNNEKLLSTLIDNLPVNVYVKDTESRKILVNKAECEYLDVENPNDILGKTDHDLYPLESATLSREEDLMVLNTLRPIIGKETLNIKKNGKETTFLSSKIPLLNNKGVAYGLIGISLDISKLKEKEHELRNIINVASTQNKKLLNFAHIVSHNLRSHSANFSMLLSFLKTEKDQEERKLIMKMLGDASNNLMEALDNLNDVITINTQTNIKKKEIDLNTKINDISKHLADYLVNNKATVNNNVPLNFKVKSVPEYLESMLVNFITNAVKYKNPDKSPQITFSATKENHYTILTIADNGLGIDLKKYGKKMFGMYKTFHEHKDAKGIGLYITKNQIEAMNGKIEVSSELGKGTVFKVLFNEKD